MKIKKKLLIILMVSIIFIYKSGMINKKKSNVILFLHGFPELSYSYRYLMHYFSKDGYFCIAPDQRGYGNTKLIENKKDKISNYSILNLTKRYLLFSKKTRSIKN